MINDRNDGEQKRESVQFLKPRDLRRLYAKVHPDRYMNDQGEDSPHFWGSRLMNILNDLAATDQLENWPPTLRVQILRGQHPEVKFVRTLGDRAEVSEPIRLPKKPKPFLYALDAYTTGKSWDEVVQLLGAQSGETHNQERIEAFEVQIASIKSFDDAGKAAKAIHTSIDRPHERRSLMGLLMNAVGIFLTEKTLECHDLVSLQRLREETTDFFRTEGGQLFRQVTLMDVLDSRALAIGKEMLSRAITKEQVSDAMSAIKAHPFEFAFVYEQPFTETREDAIAKIDFLSKLRTKRSESGLDELLREVDAYQFQSADLAPVFKKQIRDYVERKREVYWPRVERKSMPK